MISNINIGYRTRLREVTVKVLKVNVPILNALREGGLISNYKVDFLDPTKFRVELHLIPDGVNKALSLKAISTPGARRYVKVSHLSTRYKSPFVILSTTRGIIASSSFLEDRPHIGGECFFIVESHITPR
jgi:ribosomal protein S8